MIEVFGYIASFFVGLVLGMIGGGGSMLCIPILIYLFSVEIVEATAYSLFIVGISSLAGSMQCYKNSLVDFRVGLIFGLPAIVSKFYMRKWGVPLIPEVLFEIGPLVITRRFLMLGVFSLLIIIAATTMIRRRWNKDREVIAKSDFSLGVCGAIIGVVTGISGLGGGFIIMPSLIFIAGIKFKKAIGTTLLIIAMSSLIAFTGDLWNFDADWRFLGLITGIAVLGILAGNIFSRFIPSLHLRKSFGWFVLLMGFGVLIKELLLLK